MTSAATTPEDLCRALVDAPHALAADDAQRLLSYAQALATHVGPNLTSLKDVARIVEVLVQPSLLFAWAVEDAPARIVDVGTGNGFPGIAAAALWPRAQVLLVERRGHKANAVRALVQATGFANVEVQACDARELPREAPEWMGVCDLVTARAVGPLAETTRMCAALLAPGGCVAHAKSATLSAGERAEGESMARSLGLRTQKDLSQKHLSTGRLVRYIRAAS